MNLKYHKWLSFCDRERFYRKLGAVVDVSSWMAISGNSGEYEPFLLTLTEMKHFRFLVAFVTLGHSLSWLRALFHLMFHLMTRLWIKK